MARTSLLPTVAMYRAVEKVAHMIVASHRRKAMLPHRPEDVAEMASLIESSADFRGKGRIIRQWHQAWRQAYEGPSRKTHARLVDMAGAHPAADKLIMDLIRGRSGKFAFEDERVLELLVDKAVSEPLKTDFNPARPEETDWNQAYLLLEELQGPRWEERLVSRAFMRRMDDLGEKHNDSSARAMRWLMVELLVERATANPDRNVRAHAGDAIRQLAAQRDLASAFFPFLVTSALPYGSMKNGAAVAKRARLLVADLIEHVRADMIVAVLEPLHRGHVRCVTVRTSLPRNGRWSRHSASPLRAGELLATLENSETYRLTQETRLRHLSAELAEEDRKAKIIPIRPGMEEALPQPQAVPR